MPIDPVRRAPVPPSTTWLWELTSAVNLLIATGIGSGTYSPLWEDIVGAPEEFPPSAHVHDDSYYNKTAISTILSGYEQDLGHPGVDGYVLSSTIAGERSWVAQSAGGGSCFEADGNGDYMPAVTPVADALFEADINGDIEPK